MIKAMKEEHSRIGKLRNNVIEFKEEVEIQEKSLEINWKEHKLCSLERAMDVLLLLYPPLQKEKKKKKPHLPAFV